ncbi:hypothetical protein QO005_001213 [Rhizobium paknamense]|uniref:Uncharacterized protein n=1 Tax=Rhizobium paknamense TaxID=1206817 RepID=A0ABU0IB47_9HYPH|nr:hypothetical protein [Rhizobium paknamense]
MNRPAALRPCVGQTGLRRVCLKQRRLSTTVVHSTSLNRLLLVRLGWSGRITATAIADASAASFFWRLMNDLMQIRVEPHIVANVPLYSQRKSVRSST